MKYKIGERVKYTIDNTNVVIYDYGTDDIIYVVHSKGNCSHLLAVKERHLVRYTE